MNSEHIIWPIYLRVGSTPRSLLNHTHPRGWTRLLYMLISPSILSSIPKTNAKWSFNSTTSELSDIQIRTTSKTTLPYQKMINATGFGRRNTKQIGGRLGYWPNDRPTTPSSPWPDSLALITPFPLPIYLNGLFISRSDRHRTHIEQIMSVNPLLTETKSSSILPT